MNEIDVLINALAFSPENQALRKLIIDKMFQAGQFDCVVEQCIAGLQSSPDCTDFLAPLAKSYLNLWKTSQALVITEKLIETDDPSFKILHAQALYQNGNVSAARERYQDAIDEDPELEIPEWTHKLSADSQSPEVRIMAGGESSATVETEAQRPEFNFDSVGGMETIKENIRMKIIYPLQNAALFAAYGKKAGGGVLLYGPPGCGKTLIARATAGEIHSDFLAIGLHQILDMYLGQSEKQLHDVFEKARRCAPSVLFFDEVDALAAKRSEMQHSAGKQVINQFLAELDGVNTSNDGVLVLAATNAPWDMDIAFRRPGRFDRIVFVSPPDAAAREVIWRLHLKDKPVGDINYSALVQKSKGYSGADIAGVIDATIENLLAEIMKTGKRIPLTTKLLLQTLQRSHASTTEWLATASNYVTYANEEGFYDDISDYMKNKE